MSLKEIVSIFKDLGFWYVVIGPLLIFVTGMSAVAELDIPMTFVLALIAFYGYIMTWHGVTMHWHKKAREEKDILKSIKADEKWNLGVMRVVAGMIVVAIGLHLIYSYLAG